MEKGARDLKKISSDEPLLPVVAPIPEPSVQKEIPALPPALDRVLKTAALNRATEILIERKSGWSLVRERIRGVLITDLRANLGDVEILAVFNFVFKTQEPKKENGIKWCEFDVQLSLNGEPYECRFLFSESKGFSVLSIHLVRVAEDAFNPTGWGMGPNQTQILENFLGRSHGLVLFCGTDTDPVTPTLHACAKKVGTPEKHLVAVSARPETWFVGVEPMVSYGDNDAFAHFLRLGFRHSPDLLIADPITRKDHLAVCVAEAQRGRLVFARMYGADAADALMQMLATDIEPYMLGSALLGVIAQRSLRLNCQHCQDKDTVSRDRLKDLGIPVGMQPAAFYRGKGCDACMKTGFDRETNIFEVFELNDDLRVKLSPSVKSDAFRSMMKASGLMTLRQVALHKAINGQTSLAEVFRVTS